MIGPNKNPLTTPDSLAADGMQGAGAKAEGQCRRDDTPSEAVARLFLRVAIASGQHWADRYSHMTADPAPGMVEAADFLDLAADALAGEASP
jgi:hypothetical protein